MIFLAGSAASGKTKKAVAYGWKERKTSEDGVLLFSLQHEKEGDVEDSAEHVRAGGAFQDRN